MYSQNNIKKRLGLSYQPENPFVKKIYGDCRKTAGVLLKLKVKKTKTEQGPKREVVSTTVIGRVNTIYKFECLYFFSLSNKHFLTSTENIKIPSATIQIVVSWS